MEQHAAAHQRHHTRDTADNNRTNLFEPMADTQRIKQGNRRQQTHQVTNKDHQHANMEQDRAHDQLLAAQHLA